jgi:hypothetical protein
MTVRSPECDGGRSGFASDKRHRSGTVLTGVFDTTTAADND